MTHVETFLLLIEAAFLGGFVGYERERSNQPAGLRTHIILCLGSALITIVSYRFASPGTPYDPTRIAAQIVSGIGFLGAGAILRMGASVRGITTAASIWATAGIGMAVGARLHVEAISATAILLLSLIVLKKFRVRFTGRLLEVQVRQEDERIIEELEEILLKEHCIVRSVEVRKRSGTGMVHIQMEMGVPPRGFEPAHLIEVLTRNPNVVQAEVH